MKTLLSLAVLGFALSACGGSDADPYEEALMRAEAKEAEARALAADTPCNGAAQCANLTLLTTRVSCPNYVYKPYSLVAPQAGAASAAAAEQRTLAAQANAMAPGSGTACPAIITTPPTLSCQQSRCLAAG